VPLDQPGPDDIRRYHAHLLGERKPPVNTVVLNICALRFLYIKVLKRRDMKADLPYPKQRLRLPVILSPAEVAQPDDAFGGLVLLRPNRRSRGDYWSIFRPVLIRGSRAGHPDTGVAHRRHPAGAAIAPGIALSRRLQRAVVPVDVAETKSGQVSRAQSQSSQHQ
jgi:hypothetical protein